MMKEMRENMPLIMWIIVISFLITIVVSWGAGGFKGSGPKQGVIAEVGSKEILYDVFLKKFQDRLASERAKDEKAQIGEEEMTKIRGEVWDALMHDALVNYTAKKIGLKTADKEVAWAVRNNPPENVVKSEYFQTDGKFYIAKWNAYLDNPQATQILVQLEEDYRMSLSNRKLIERVVAPIYVSNDEILRDFLDQYGRFSAIIASYPVRNIEVDSSSISEGEIEKYYFDHQEQYWHPELRAVSSVTVSNTATQEDSARILEQAQELIERVRAGEDFAELTKVYSEDPGSASKGGDLGYFSRGRMVKEFEEAAFKTPVGELSAPIETRFGVHIIKVVDHKTKGEEDSVRASHILLSWKASPETEERANEEARDFQERAKKIGVQKAAEEFDLKVVDTDHFAQRRGVIPGFGNQKAAVDFIFSESIGKVSFPYETGKGYTVFICRDMIPEGIQSLTEVRSQVLNLLVSDKKLEIAVEKVEALRKEISTADNLVPVALRDGLSIDTVASTLATGFFGPMGSNKFVGRQLYSLDVGQLSPVMKTERGAFMAVLTEKAPFDSTSFESKKSEIGQKLSRTKQNAVYSDWLFSIEKESGLRDNRYLYFSKY